MPFSVKLALLVFLGVFLGEVILLSSFKDTYYARCEKPQYDQYKAEKAR